jgi:transposase InsO family protein
MRIWCLLYWASARQVCRECPGRTIPLTLTPSAKREAIRIMTAEHDLPIVRACQVARLSRAAYYKPGVHVVHVLNRLVTRRKASNYLFVDNGSEFSGRVLELWAYRCGVRMDFSRPGKPTDNCYVVTFNGSFRANA